MLTEPDTALQFFITPYLSSYTVFYNQIKEEARYKQHQRITMMFLEMDIGLWGYLMAVECAQHIQKMVNG